MPGTEIEQSTPNRGYKLPFPTNKLAFDVLRARDTLALIDGDVTALIEALAAKAGLISPEFVGIPKAPTPANTDDSNQIATTAFVQAVLDAFDTSGFAPITDPIFLGNPRAPTRTPGDNTTSLATTAFIAAAVALLKGSPPTALDSIQKLATSIGNDATFAATVSGNINTAINLIPTWFTGMELSSNAGNPNQHLDIKPGTVKNGLLTATLATVMTKQANAVWAAGNNAGFLEVGPKQASKTYFVHALRKVSDGSIDFIASLQPLEANVVPPAGYTVMVRVGIFLTDASNNNVRMIQRGNRVNLITQLWISTATSLTSLATSTLIPVGLSVDAGLYLNIQVSTTGADGYIVISDADGGGSLLNSNAPWRVATRGRTGNDYPDSSLAAGYARTNDAGQLYVVIGHTSTSISSQIYVTGWCDYQSKRLWG